MYLHRFFFGSQSLKDPAPTSLQGVWVDRLSCRVDQTTEFLQEWDPTSSPCLLWKKIFQKHSGEKLHRVRDAASIHVYYNMRMELSLCHHSRELSSASFHNIIFHPLYGIPTPLHVHSCPEIISFRRIVAILCLMFPNS